MPEISQIVPESMPTITPKTTTRTVTFQVPPKSPKEEVSPPPQDPSTENKPVDKPDAARVAALIKKERELYQRQQKLSAREKEIEATQEKYKPWQEAATLAQQDKLEAIKRLGISYDDLTNQVLNKGQVPPEVLAQIKAEEVAKTQIEALEKKLRTEAEETQRVNYQKAKTNLTNEAKSLVESSDKFPLVKSVGCYQDITEYIESEYHRTDRMLSVEQATIQMEKDIREGLELLNKVLTPQKEEPKVEEKPVSAEPQNQKVTTLTHKTTAQPPAAKPLTAAEKRQRAIDVFYGRA